MAKYLCPCCNQPFNGKKCRNCFYEAFDEEIAHGLHTHKGEPLVIDAPVRRPIPRKDPFGCEKKTAKKKIPKWLVWVLIVCLLEPVLVIAGSFIEDFSDTVSDVFSAEEPVPDVAVPEGYQKLFAQDGFTLYLGDYADGYYPLILENTTHWDTRLWAGSMVMGDFLMGQSYAVCDSPAGTTREGEVYLDTLDLSYAVMDKPGDIQMAFAIYEEDSYETILTGEVTIPGEGTLQTQPPAGEVLLETKECQIRSLGYVRDTYEPDRLSSGSVLFYIENKTDRLFSYYLKEAFADGEAVDLGVWSELPGNTRTVTRMWLYDLEELDAPEAVESLELHFAAYDELVEAGSLDLGTVTISIK